MIRRQTSRFTVSSIFYYLVLGSLALAIGGCTSHSEIVDIEGTAASQESIAQPKTEQIQDTQVHLNLDEAGIALRGYDPVSYFTEAEPVKGQEAHSFTWNDATWHFATAENRDLFSNEPEKYAPANGGYCTFGIVLKKKFDGDPQVWSVIKSRLYVFLNEDVQQKFLQDSAGNLQKVSANWPVIQFKSPGEL
ncbi:YHS domain-containing protein [Leptolyngbya cf. ectocarpi LEGE 11479]|uniref:YHS domain-containing protein n=1 Tax=Leptolyngbya cf. ectocarpi LEGE 11479 TaxID=1828722 RepID=A0A928ZQW1_LEPEC|nr:YHS domain-containing (seleno)protein [Leptolyngbya ectocarpi]MBE9065863.1 YHS domain-containing protein [Leptolyngbya cf. ectocarpi LEGE 11479]